MTARRKIKTLRRALALLEGGHRAEAERLIAQLRAQTRFGQRSSDLIAPVRALVLAPRELSDARHDDATTLAAEAK